MAKSTPPDRAKHPGRSVTRESHEAPQALNTVHGGSVCDPMQKGAHILSGSGGAAVCMPTPSLTDQRPRWGQAGKPRGKSRHSLQSKQHR